jgi:hypothetical protein
MTNFTLNSITFVPFGSKIVKRQTCTPPWLRAFQQNKTKQKVKWGPHDLGGLGHDYKQNKTKLYPNYI